MKSENPIPVNEADRLWALAEFDIDYTEVSEVFSDLTRLAAKVAGTEVSLINLIDSYTQWTIANYGLPLEQMAREDSTCQYTITMEEQFEVKELSKDERFENKFYVTHEPYADYYFGVPLTTGDGYNLGALCVLDKKEKDLSPEKIELLKIIASEVVNRLVTYKLVEDLKNKILSSEEIKKKVAHDIRGPIGGIIGLTKLIKDRGEKNQLNEVLDFITMIHKAGHSLLELVTEILNSEDKIDLDKKELKNDELSLFLFREKLEKLYTPQAKNKEINFAVYCTSENIHTPFRKNKLLQITGNLITNAIKFTPVNGRVIVEIGLFEQDGINNLQIIVKDTGTGLCETEIAQILTGEKSSSGGTEGESGSGFGLQLVKQLTTSLKGSMNIHSEPGRGSVFTIKLPFEIILETQSSL